MKISNKTKVIILTILGILIILLSISYAYFKPILDTEKSTSIEVVAKTLDQLMFIQGDQLSLELNQQNFAEGMPNVTGSTTTTAKLIANTNTKTATKTYYVYFYVGLNQFDYSTPTNEPEIILTLKNPQGNNITSISGLTYVTKPDVSGFDITNFTGFVTIANEYSISTTSTTVGIEQDWQATVTIRNLDMDQSQQAGNELSAQLVLSSDPKTTFINFDDLILANNLGVEYIEAKTTPNFANVANTNEGMFAAEDDYGTSYYFRGAADNNWVKFGKYLGNDIWWRIVRINGDNSIRLIYHGTRIPREEEKVNNFCFDNSFASYALTINTFSYLIDGEIAWEFDGAKQQVIEFIDLIFGLYYEETGTTHKEMENVFKSKTANDWWYLLDCCLLDPEYDAQGEEKHMRNLIILIGERLICPVFELEEQFNVVPYYNAGYMFEPGLLRGHAHSSNVKNVLDLMYGELLSAYSYSISDTSFCNDRSAFSDEHGQNEVHVLNENVYPGSNIRIRNLAPSLKCPYKEDAYTVNDLQFGNGKLSYPIGLLTADEAMFAGLNLSNSTRDSYLFSVRSYWTMSPEFISPVNNEYSTFVYSIDMRINNYSVAATIIDGDYGGVRPVLSIVPDVVVSGSGQWNDPYVIH